MVELPRRIRSSLRVAPDGDAEGARPGAVEISADLASGVVLCANRDQDLQDKLVPSSRSSSNPDTDPAGG